LLVVVVVAAAAALQTEECFTRPQFLYLFELLLITIKNGTDVDLEFFLWVEPDIFERLATADMVKHQSIYTIEEVYCDAYLALF
jgi:hypothetical protein